MRSLTSFFACLLAIKQTGFIQAQNVAFNCRDVDELEGIAGLFGAIEASDKQNEITELRCQNEEEISGNFPEEFPSMPNLESV